MKRLFALCLCFLIVAAMVTGCNSKPSSSDEGDGGEPAPAEGPKKIAMISEPVGTTPFLMQMVNKLAEVLDSLIFSVSKSMASVSRNQ